MQIALGQLTPLDPLELMQCMGSTAAIDSNAPLVRRFVAEATRNVWEAELQVAAVLENVHHKIVPLPDHRCLPLARTASAVIRKGRGTSICKSLLLTACWRLLGLPSRMRLAVLTRSDSRHHGPRPSACRVIQGATEFLLNLEWQLVLPAFAAAPQEISSVDPERLLMRPNAVDAWIFSNPFLDVPKISDIRRFQQLAKQQNAAARDIPLKRKSSQPLGKKHD